MSVSSEYVASIRLRLRNASAALDSEIVDLIHAARADLVLGGVVPEKAKDETDPLILQAIATYAKAEFGLDNPDADQYRAAYRSQRNALTLSSDYIKSEV